MNTLIDGIDYGPLAQLIGKWVGNKGLDNAPDTNAEPELTPFTDELTFTAAGSAKNANEQQLVAVKYHHLVCRQEDGQIFHDQIGHWLYEQSSNLLMHSISIPHGLCVLAGGDYQKNNDESIFNVAAKSDSQTFGIVQSPFMLKKATTKAFTMHLRIKGNELYYREITELHIYGKNFEHTDQSTLFQVIDDLS